MKTATQLVKVTIYIVKIKASSSTDVLDELTFDLFIHFVQLELI